MPKPPVEAVGLSDRIARIPGEYFTPEARALCERVKHKSELSDNEMVMLAMVAAQAALSKYFHPSERDAEETLNTIGRILDHDAVVAALYRKIKLGDEKPSGPPAIAGP